uniref:G-protein alpha subunit n=1 Tax=Heterorhabditis bacteriophora TaxID=37862 RepID=A0A1I7XLQ2_HETBA
MKFATPLPVFGMMKPFKLFMGKGVKLFDIGGQRIDRRKWATMYDGIDAIFFCLAMSEYDQTMSEDLITNRLTDALSLLEKISIEPKFAKTPIFLFLNEVDVFREKLSLIPLENYQPEYKGGSVEDALDFVENLALQSLVGRDKSLIHVYRISCIDTDQMSKILQKVFKEVLKAI